MPETSLGRSKTKSATSPANRRGSWPAFTHGPTRGQPLVLIMGLGMQLVAWPDGLVAALVAAGFRVIRFDNRDIGLSQHFAAAGVPNLWVQSARYALKLPLKPAYTLADLADDTVALMDALGLASAHVCGASMGGMVAQHVAARHPARVRSLSLIMSTSGARHLPAPSWKLRSVLLSRPAASGGVDAVVAHHARVYRSIGSPPPYAAEPIALKQRVRAAVERSYRPDSVTRQLVAIAADGDRSAMLARIKAPTQVIHGNDDPLVPVASAHDLAQKIPGAELDLIDGMGHDLPEALWPRFAANVRTVAGRAVRS